MRMPYTTSAPACHLSRKYRDELRRILEIHIKLDRCVPATLHVAGKDGSLESEVPRKSKDPHPRIAGCHFLQYRKGAIRAVIVCDDKFEPEPIGKLREDRMEALEERTNIQFLVVSREHDRDEGHVSMKPS